jgi:Domain of unknown function (DUF4272)
MHDPATIRRQSLAIAAKLGCEASKSLPLLDEQKPLRSKDEIVDRLLAMLCVAATAYGFDHAKANDWLKRQATTDQLTGTERSYLATGVGNKQQFMRQIEGMWALAWAIGLVLDLDFASRCSQAFVTMLPNLKADNSAVEFRSKAFVRPAIEIIAALDLAYCLHWAVRDAELSATPMLGKVDPWIIVERRRALEWLVSENSWDDVQMDT